MVRSHLIGILCLGPALAAGCGDSFANSPAPLFGTPLVINGEPVGPAIIDTGGGYEVLLRDSFGLRVAVQAEVLAFGGVELVDVTEGFHYTAGGWEATVDGAIVGLSVCECNGLGFFFFRKTGAVLELDFRELRSAFLTVVPSGGVTIPFAASPSHLPDFDGAFVEVEVVSDGESRSVLGLLDTGTNASVMRRGLVGNSPAPGPDRQSITVEQEQLGIVALQVGLFETAGLPDIILGTDVMGAWADRWYFYFAPEGGAVTIIPPEDVSAASAPVAAFRP